MSWNLKWEGRPTEFLPEHLTTSGKPGRIAHTAREAIWESVQTIAEASPSALAEVTASGWEEPQEPGLGQFNLSIVVKSGDIASASTSQEQAVAPSVPEPASSA